MKRLFQRTALTVLTATMVFSCEALAGPVRLANAYHQAVALGDKKTKPLGGRLIWVGEKRGEIEGYLRQYWPAPCDEAMVFAEPAPHAGELMLAVACKRGGRVQVDRSIPERQERVVQDVSVAAWNQFAERALQWDIAGAPVGLDPEMERTQRSDDRAFLNSFAPLLALYRDNRWHVLPMRVWETFDLPRVQRSRWQDAMIDLLGMDRQQLDARDEKARADRGRFREDGKLDEAIRAGDLDTFKQVFDGLEYLPRNGYEVYRKLIEAMQKGHEAMVIHALRSGTPAYLTRDEAPMPDMSSSPALAEALIDSVRCAKCTSSEQRERALKIVARWLEIVDKAQAEGGAGGVGQQGLRQELEAAVVKRICP